MSRRSAGALSTPVAVQNELADEFLDTAGDQSPKRPDGPEAASCRDRRSAERNVRFVIDIVYGFCDVVFDSA